MLPAQAVDDVPKTVGASSIARLTILEPDVTKGRFIIRKLDGVRTTLRFDFDSNFQNPKAFVRRDIKQTIDFSKPDGVERTRHVHTTLRFAVVRAVLVAKPDCGNTTQRLNVVRAVHVANGLHIMTLPISSCALCTSRNRMPSIRHYAPARDKCSSRETGCRFTTLCQGVLRTDQVTMVAIRLYISASCVLCMSRNRMPSTRHYAPASCVLCWSRNPIASIRHSAQTSCVQ